MAIYVGNLSYTLKENDLNNVFSEFGNVNTVKIIKDRNTGRSKGYGFVEMDNDDAEDSAVAALNGKDLMGRNMVVNKARTQDNR
jgi:RNA recognition motif-containing protein